MSAKVQPMPYVPPEGFIDYFYADSGKSPDRYPCDFQWDGPDQFTETTYGKNKDSGKHWVKVGEHDRGVDFEVRQVYSPKVGEHDTSPHEHMRARYYMVGNVTLMWGQGWTPEPAAPVTPGDARSWQYVWVLRVPLRPTV
jgi:hypothetical protein